VNAKLFLYRNIYLGGNGNVEKIEVFSLKRIDEITLSIIEISFCIKFKLKSIEKKDWVEVSRIKFKPLKIGRFFISSSFYAEGAPINKILLVINSGLAFGTGHHFTTKCCLEMILYLYELGFVPRTSIDVGCGTGILSLATAKLFRSRVYAVDNDQNALEVTRENIEKNNVSSLVKVFKSEGFNGSSLNAKGRYNLILANILYKPIKRLLLDFYKNLEPNGYLILSGLNKKQAKDIRNICLLFNFRLVRQQSEDNWTGLLLRKG